MSTDTYILNTRLARVATIARMRLLTGDAYASQGRTLFTDQEMLIFITDLDPSWESKGQKALGYLDPEDIPAVVTTEDNRLEGKLADFDTWNDLVRRASAEVCLALSMRNPEWSPGRHAAYRVRAQELLPAFLDVARS